MALRFSIRTKLALGVAAVLAPLLLSAPVLHAEALDVSERVTRMALRDRPALAAVHGMEDALAAAGLAVTAYVVDPMPAALERLRGEEQRFRGALRGWRSLAPPGTVEGLAPRVEQAFDRYLALGQSLIHLRGTREGAPGATMQAAWRDAIAARHALDALLDRDLKRPLEADLTRTQDELVATGRRAAARVLALIAVSLALGAAVTLAIAGSLLRPLRHLLGTIESVRGGDLSRRAQATSTDETAQIVEAFNRMADDLLATTVSRRYVEGIIRSMSESLIVVAADGAVTTVNPAACALLGWREPELVGAPFVRVLDTWADVAAQAATAPVHDLETHYRTRDGRVVPVLLYADRLVLDDGRDPVVVCVALDMTEIQRSRQQLAQSRERLRKLARHLNATVEAERTAIAREIHDQLGQAMTCLKLDVRRLREELARGGGDTAARLAGRLGSMGELIDESVRLVRRVATELRPAALDDLGLGPALEALAEQFGQRTGLACRVELESDVSLSPSQATALYRIAQEALTNVARHAHATRVDLRLRAEDSSVVLEIEDNGRGITPSEVTAPRSLGLLGMEERAQEHGATVHIDGASGRGTRVSVVLDLAASAAIPEGLTA